MREPIYQFFSLEEYQQRLEDLRSRMEKKGVDVMLIHTPENLYYLTGYQTPGYYWYQTLIVPMEQDPVFITRLIESTNVGPLTWVEDSRPYQDYEDWIAHTRDALVSMGLDNGSIGLEYNCFFLTSKDEKRLTAMLPSATFVDCSGSVEEGRVVKSTQEIEYIRQAARAAEAGIRAGIEASVVGATENEVASEIHRAQILAGSEYTGLPLFIRAGVRAYMTHSTWYRKRLEPHEDVSFEVPGCIHRYHAAMYRQVYLGDPPSAFVRATEVAMSTLQEAKNAIRPGVTAGDAFDVVQKSLQDAGYQGKPNRAAYSIGIAFAPDWGEGHILSITKGEKRSFQPNMVFHLTAGSALTPELSNVRRAICTDTILVTAEGCETLTDGVERKLYVK